MPDVVIARLNALGQGQPKDLNFLGRKKLPIGELGITGVNGGVTEAPHIVMIELETYLDPILSGADTLTELVEIQYMPTVEL